MRLSSLSKSLAGTHRFSLALPFPFSRSQPPRCSLSPLYRENVSSTTSFQQFQSRSTVTAFLISPPGRFYATPSLLLSLSLSPFFNREWILRDSNAQRRESKNAISLESIWRALSLPVESTFVPLFPRLSPTIRRHHTCRRHLNARRSSLRQSIFSHALHPPRSDLASQNNYRSRRTNDIFQDNVYEGCTMEICMYIFFIQILIYSSTAEAETTLILQYKFTNFVG